LPEVRQRNTLKAMQALERVGCLTDQEYSILDNTYRFLRKTEHRLQLLFDLQTHCLPEKEEELSKLALRMGYGDASARPHESRSEDGPTEASAPGRPASMLQPLSAFLQDYREKTNLNRKILDHLLHQTFQGEDGQAVPESDLILDPHPEPETI